MMKPCPFCGGPAYYTESVNGSRMAYCGCQQCGIAYKAQKVNGPQGMYLTMDVISAWNKRVAVEKSQSEQAADPGEAKP